MQDSLTLVALLYLEPGRSADFERFERAAARIMRRYGGAIERRIALERTDDLSRPDEVHVVRFRDRASFARYREDPELQGLAALRARAIRRTVVWEGADDTCFDPSDPSEPTTDGRPVEKGAEPL